MARFGIYSEGGRIFSSWVPSLSPLSSLTFLFEGRRYLQSQPTLSQQQVIRNQNFCKVLKNGQRNRPSKVIDWIYCCYCCVKGTFLQQSESPLFVNRKWSVIWAIRSPICVTIMTNAPGNAYELRSLTALYRSSLRVPYGAWRPKIFVLTRTSFSFPLQPRHGSPCLPKETPRGEFQPSMYLLRLRK